MHAGTLALNYVSELVRITYRTNFRDRLALAAYHAPRVPMLWITWVGCILFWTFQVVLPAMRMLPPERSLFARCVTFLVVELLIVFILAGVWVTFTLLAMISRRNKTIYCDRTITLGEEGYVIESPYGRSESRWSVIQKLVRTHSHVFMYVNGDNAVVIPRRAFESTSQWDAFYEICRQHTTH